jgi:RNA polymerase sigma-70 factor (ECF subfamily)
MDPESSLELLRRARGGDRQALERLCSTYRMQLVRWASGRLPRWAREVLDTEDLVQEVMLRTIPKMDAIEPRHDGALRAYLRQAVYNRIQDEVRRVHRRPVRGELDAPVDPGPSPLEETVGRQLLERYEAALQRLRPDDREAIVARVEMGLGYEQIATALGRPSIAAAQMAVSRALVRLAQEMEGD